MESWMNEDHNFGKNDTVTFAINGKIYYANNKNARPQMSLNEYIRDVAGLKGTKYMCYEGGCGSCIVTVTSVDPLTQKKRSYGVNSCLVPVLGCHGFSVTTVEGLGSQKRGYHWIQTQLAEYNGSQCGYCSPGQVMNMYSLLQGNPNITKEEVENSFGSNICRCTGYRPILDAFKGLASDATKNCTVDIEDAAVSCRSKGTCRVDCEDSHDEMDYVELALSPKSLKLSYGIINWYRAASVGEIFQIFDLIGNSSYRLIAGNTAQGVYRPPPSSTYIDISGIGELKKCRVNATKMTVGANTTLNDFMNFLKRTAAQNNLLYGYGKVLADHIDLVAHVSVRNIGTLAGNLSIKRDHPEFPSDIFLILETVGATLMIRDPTGYEKRFTMLEYLQLNMYKRVITKIVLPPLSSIHYFIQTYKIMPRAQNVHALVNAGFKFRLKTGKFEVEERPTVVYGNINPHFVHAVSTESYLMGQSLKSQSVMKIGFDILSRELQPDFEPTEASPKYRRLLALGLFYRMKNVIKNAMGVRQRFPLDSQAVED